MMTVMEHIMKGDDDMIVTTMAVMIMEIRKKTAIIFNATAAITNEGISTVEIISIATRVKRMGIKM